MKNFILLLFSIWINTAQGQTKSFDYAYVNNKGICVYSIAEKKEYFIVEIGQNPSISPDGKKLAYTDFKGTKRLLAIIDLNTKAKTILSTYCDNCYGPLWSPDGKYIAYNAWDKTKKKRWSIALINADNTQARVLSVPNNNFYSPSWLSDSKHLSVHNMNDVLVIDLSGKVTDTLKFNNLKKAIPSLLGFSSSDQFTFTYDNKKIVFRTEIDENAGDGTPANAAFIYDTFTKKALQISPKGFIVVQATIRGNQIFLELTKLNSPTSSIYTVGTDGKNLKMLFPGCGSISASRR